MLQLPNQEQFQTWMTRLQDARQKHADEPLGTVLSDVIAKLEAIRELAVEWKSSPDPQRRQEAREEGLRLVDQLRALVDEKFIKEIES